MSARRSIGAPRACSGAMYSGVPARLVCATGAPMRRDAGRPRDEPEVEHLDDAVAVDHEVRRLDVAVREARALRLAQAERGGADRRERILDAQRAAGDALGERRAGDVLHREVQPAVVLADEVDVRDVRVLDASLCARFADQPIAARGVVRGRGRQHLDRDRAIEREVGREVDLAHAARAEEALDAVVAQARAGLELARRRRRANAVSSSSAGIVGDRGNFFWLGSRSCSRLCTPCRTRSARARRLWAPRWPSISWRPSAEHASATSGVARLSRKSRVL